MRNSSIRRNPAEIVYAAVSSTKNFFKETKVCWRKTAPLSKLSRKRKSSGLNWLQNVITVKVRISRLLGIRKLFLMMMLERELKVWHLDFASAEAFLAPISLRKLSAAPKCICVSLHFREILDPRLVINLGKCHQGDRSGSRRKFGKCNTCPKIICAHIVWK